MLAYSRIAAAAVIRHKVWPAAFSAIKGVYKVEDEEEQIPGYFDASAVSMKEVVIARHDQEANAGIDVYHNDCLAIRNSTIHKPQDC